jgi:hypothetical protein
MNGAHLTSQRAINGPSKPTADAPEGGDYAIVVDGQIIAEVFYRSSPTHTHDACATARLFSAAQDLLDALQDLLRANTEAANFSMSMVTDREEFDGFLRECEAKVDAAETKARAAIAKATGGV